MIEKTSTYRDEKSSNIITWIMSQKAI